jgi:hypothetical protein
MGLGSGIRKKPILDPGSRGQKGTGSRIRNTGIHLARPYCGWWKGIHPARPLTGADGMLYDTEKSYVNTGMAEESESGIGISSGRQLPLSGIGIPASGFSGPIVYTMK